MTEDSKSIDTPVNKRILKGPTNDEGGMTIIEVEEFADVSDDGIPMLRVVHKKPRFLTREQADDFLLTGRLL